ncbi:hypothetical protein L1077_16540 [Pseudoalteromonas luteoviolacea]|uniref:hypothetical protein n=1 Tax=Pseudoalteromonas luteoviolacea TaxID=43657 RepID=UPI001F1B5233|nr:hypothetical protein [Pseudoalteromonas luteoviolacea]MCF6441046.1 hypothetical protein [Pseudoalteromonas luteoviolacea]
MANNLLISYDLNSPGQDYTRVIEKIKTLGEWAKVHKSYWYLNSNYSAKEAASIIWKEMDQNDSLMVVNTTTNDASWFNVHHDVDAFLKEKWFK